MINIYHSSVALLSKSIIRNFLY